MLKPDVIAAIRAVLDRELDAMVRANALARDEATTNKPENKYDTRAIEASYLASAQADRMVDLKQMIGFYDAFDPGIRATVQVGALVELEDDRGSRWVFIAPRGGGNGVTVDGIDITVLSTRSPLGRALAGLSEGDEATWDTPRGPRSLEIVTLH
jgi:transcription elongation GreA/GreB family factor